MHSSHTLAKECSQFSKPGFNGTWTLNFKILKLDLEKAEEPEIKLPTSIGSLKRQEFQKNLYFCFIAYAKAFDCVDHKNCGKYFKRWEYQTTLPDSWEKQQFVPDMEQWTGSKLGKVYVKDVYCYTDYLTYM